MISPMRKLSGVCRQSGSRPVQRLGAARDGVLDAHRQPVRRRGLSRIAATSAIRLAAI